MNVFIIFVVFLYFLNGLAMLVTGLFLWRKFRDDFEIQTVGGVLALTSVIIFVMSLRLLLSALGEISETLALNIFSAEYIITLGLTLPFVFPRLLFLIFRRPIVKKWGLLLGASLYFIYLVMHLTQRSQITPHYTIHGLFFEIPYSQKVFLGVVLVLFFTAIFCRVGFHFFQWRKTKIFPYRLLIYLSLLFLVAMIGSIVYTPFPSWQSILAYVFSVAGILTIYFLSSQELIKKEELILTIEEKEERIDAQLQLQKLTEGIESKMKILEKETETRDKETELKMRDLKKEIERLKKELEEK